LKKRILLIISIVTLLIPNLFAQGANESSNKIELTMGSWRADDVTQMNELLNAYKEVAPNVSIDFKPTNPSDYNTTLRLQLDSATGPDLMYARSYKTGQELFESGYFADCSNIEGLKNFTDSSLKEVFYV